jgi:hypothetical protein
MVGQQGFVASSTSYRVISVVLYRLFSVTVAIGVLCRPFVLVYDVEFLVYVCGSASDHVYFRVSVLALCASTFLIRLLWRPRVVVKRVKNRQSPWLRLSYVRSRFGVANNAQVLSTIQVRLRD